MNPEAEKFLRCYLTMRFQDTMSRQIDCGLEENKKYCQSYDSIIRLLRNEAYDFPETIRNDVYTIVNHPPLMKRMFAEYFYLLDDYIGCQPIGEPATAIVAATTSKLIIDDILDDLK